MEDHYKTDVLSEFSLEHILHLVTRLALPRLPLRGWFSYRNEVHTTSSLILKPQSLEE